VVLFPPGMRHIRRRQWACGRGKRPHAGRAIEGKKLTTAFSETAARRAGFTVSQRDPDRIFRAARRHSRHVRWLRIGLPAIIAAALFVVVAVNYIPSIGAFHLPTELGTLVIKGTKVTMQQPKMSGYTADSRPYQFTAKTAEQDITKPDLMELHQIEANVKMQDDSTVNVVSNSGLYDVKSEMLTLNEAVQLISSTGYEVRLNQAVIDVHKGNVVSEQPVWVKLTNGEINAKRMEVIDGGNVIRFSGGVKTIFVPSQDSSQASE
jgi:lipopolysaccharide export system protein LptC